MQLVSEKAFPSGHLPDFEDPKVGVSTASAVGSWRDGGLGPRLGDARKLLGGGSAQGMKHGEVLLMCYC